MFGGGSTALAGPGENWTIAPNTADTNSNAADFFVQGGYRRGGFAKAGQQVGEHALVGRDVAGGRRLLHDFEAG